MSKRFIDTDLWDKQAFCEASQKQKLLALFIFSKCDCIGVFKMAPMLIGAYIGEPVTEKDILSIPADIEKLESGKYWLSKFCKFQYGELTESCKPHKKYISMLNAEGLSERVLKGYTKGIETLQEKEKEKEEEKEGDTQGEKESCFSFSDFWEMYDKKTDLKKAKAKYEKISETKRAIIKAKLPAYIASTPDKQYRKLATTWLNGECWNDEVEVKPQHKPVSERGIEDYF